MTRSTMAEPKYILHWFGKQNITIAVNGEPWTIDSVLLCDQRLHSNNITIEIPKRLLQEGGITGQITMTSPRATLVSPCTVATYEFRLLGTSQFRPSHFNYGFNRLEAFPDYKVVIAKLSRRKVTTLEKRARLSLIEKESGVADTPASDTTAKKPAKKKRRELEAPTAPQPRLEAPTVTTLPPPLPLPFTVDQDPATKWHKHFKDKLPYVNYPLNTPIVLGELQGFMLCSQKYGLPMMLTLLSIFLDKREVPTDGKGIFEGFKRILADLAPTAAQTTSQQQPRGSSASPSSATRRVPLRRDPRAQDLFRDSFLEEWEGDIKKRDRTLEESAYRDIGTDPRFLRAIQNLETANRAVHSFFTQPSGAAPAPVVPPTAPAAPTQPPAAAPAPTDADETVKGAHLSAPGKRG